VERAKKLSLSACMVKFKFIRVDYDVPHLLDMCVKPNMGRKNCPATRFLLRIVNV
jgi:hypothetical protein